MGYHTTQSRRSSDGYKQKPLIHFLYCSLCSYSPNILVNLTFNFITQHIFGQYVYAYFQYNTYFNMAICTRYCVRFFLWVGVCRLACMLSVFTVTVSKFINQPNRSCIPNLNRMLTVL